MKPGEFYDAVIGELKKLGVQTGDIVMATNHCDGYNDYVTFRHIENFHMPHGVSGSSPSWHTEPKETNIGDTVSGMIIRLSLKVPV